MNDDDIRSVSELSIAASSYVMPENSDAAGNDIPKDSSQHPSRTQPNLTFNSSTANPSGANQRSTGDVGGARLERQRLRLHLKLNGSDDESPRYALVPFPASYEDAVQVALRIFDRYLPGQTTVDEVQLRSNDCLPSGKWVWADVEPASWSLLIQPGDTVGVFINKLAGVSEYQFVNGTVRVTFGHRGNDGKTEWSPVQSLEHSDYGDIDRPRTYEEAKKSVIQWLRREFSYGYPAAGLKELSDEEMASKPFRFFNFVSRNGKGEQTTHFWQEIPPSAYTDDDIWRLLVPEPQSILGFMVEYD